jgi:hypothetical protein
LLSINPTHTFASWIAGSLNVAAVVIPSDDLHVAEVVALVEFVAALL